MNERINPQQFILFCSGPDRCGKSNILKKLSEILKIDVFKASDEHDVFLNRQYDFINHLRYADTRMFDFLYQTKTSVLFDRSYVCEFVYSQFFNRETDFKVLRHLDNLGSKMGAKILICTRKSFENINDDLNPKLDSVALAKISDLYLNFTQWTKCDTHVLYVDDENIERQVTEILQWLNINKKEGHENGKQTNQV